MTTQSHTIFRDDFIAKPTVEEWYSLEDRYSAIKNSVETVEKEEPIARSGRRSLPARCLFIGIAVVRVFARIIVRVIRRIARLVRAVQWASQPPRKRVKPEIRTPGVMLDLMVFGLFVVCGGMSLVL